MSVCLVSGSTCADVASAVSTVSESVRYSVTVASFYLVAESCSEAWAQEAGEQA